MRKIGLLFLVLVAAHANAQWSVSRSRVLSFAGSPYIPVGLRISGSVAAIDQAAALGVTDVIVELPTDGTGWKEAFDALEARKMRYFVALSDRAASTSVISVEPETYRIPNISGSRKLTFAIPGCDYSLAALVNQRDASVAEVRRALLPSSVFNEVFDTRGTMEHVLLVYPHLVNQGMVDYWEGFDAHRDQLLTTLAANPARPGLRGLVNPLGAVAQFPAPNTQLIPTSPVFRLEMQAYLRSKYSVVTTALRSWQMRAVDIDSFEQMARLVPLWSRVRGVPQIWDPETNKRYDVDFKRSVIWADIQATIAQTLSKRYSKLVSSISRIWNIPIVQEEGGPSSPYNLDRSALSGAGLIVRPEPIASRLDGEARTCAAVSSWQRPGIVLATDIEMDSSDDLIRLVDDLAAIGVRGWFFRGTDATTLAAIRDHVTAQSALASSTIVPLYYPISATNPCIVRPVPGGKWMLPLAAQGERLDYGPKYGAYTFEGAGQSYTVLWSRQGTKRVVLRLAKPKEVAVEAADMSDIGLRGARGGIEVTLGEVPLIFSGTTDIPVPIDVINDTTTALAVAFATSSGKIPEADGEAINLKDYVKDLDVDPSRAIKAMRLMLRRIGIAIAPYRWIEAESSKSHSFSEAVGESGCSGAGVLRLASRIPSTLSPLFAKFEFLPAQSGPQTFWVAARIPAELRPAVSAQIGDITFHLDEAPVSFYGNGYAWYKLGTASLGAGQNVITFDVDSDDPVELSLDAIMITPLDFRPDGPNPPLILPELKPKS